MLQWLRAETASVALGVITGVATAAAFLAKLSNLPLIAVALVAIVVKLLHISRRTPRTGLAALAALVVCAAIPIGSWMAWTQTEFGDPTGSTEKIALLGWTRKPFVDWWQHPIFTPRGLWVFWSSLIASFWRGEVNWHGRPLSWGPADRFFAYLPSCCSRGDCWVTKTRWAFRFPATGDRCCNSNLLRRVSFFWRCSQFNSISAVPPARRALTRILPLAVSLVAR